MLLRNVRSVADVRGTQRQRTAPGWALLDAAELAAACERAETASAPTTDVREGGLPGPAPSELLGLRLLLPAGELSTVTICCGGAGAL